MRANKEDIGKRAGPDWVRWVLARGFILVVAAVALGCASGGLDTLRSHEPVRTAQYALAAPKVRLHTVDTGPDTAARGTIVGLHGGPGISHEYLRPLLRLARVGYRVILFDQRGAGQSSEPIDRSYALKSLVADIEAVRAWSGADRIHLIGHSWGGVMALAYLAAHADRVESVVLVDSMPASDSEYLKVAAEAFNRRLRQAKADGLVPDPEPAVSGSDCGARLLARLPIYYDNPHHPATRDLAGSSCNASTAGQTRMALLFKGFDLRPALERHGGPVLALHGAADPFGPETFAVVQRALPSARLTAATLDACGHIPWEECPERFWLQVHGFFRSLVTGD